MGQSLTKILVHIIFSTKGRQRFIRQEHESDLFAYIAKTVSNLDSQLLAINGTEDHVHLLINLSKNIALANLVKELKAASSKMMKEKQGMFTWQTGYAAFSVSESNQEAVMTYINKQKEHHHKLAFKAELEQILDLHKIDFKTEYLFHD